MPTTIDLYFDFISPYSYLVSTALPRLAAAHGAKISYRPVRLIELMRLVGNRPTTIECKNKGIYTMADVRRWAEHYRVDFAPSPYWQTIDFAQLGRGALVAGDEGREAEYVNAISPAVYGKPVDLSQPSELLAVLERAGFDGARLIDRARAPEYAEKLQSSTQEAAERGVFGSPTMFVGDEMFFGNDRLDFVAQALRSKEASAAPSPA